MLPLVSVKGSPADVGYQHGAQCREMVRKNIDLYFRLFHYYAKLDRQQACSLARKFIPVIQSFDPLLLEEIQGIAVGAQVEMDEILALNCRTELMYAETLPRDGECTALAALPEATKSGDALLGQNWDWRPSLLHTTLLLQIQQPGRPSLVTFTEAGIVGKIGFNSTGLGACLNILKVPVGKVGVPVHVLMRSILNSERFGDAIHRITCMDRGSANNCLIAHADGFVLDFEMAPQTLDYLYPKAGILVHTNHFTSERLKPLDANLTQFPDSLVRLGRARQKLAGRIGRISVEDFQEVLRDHFNYPDAVCRHPDERDPEEEHVQTVASIIMNLAKKEILISHGPPCQNDYQTLSFKNL